MSHRDCRALGEREAHVRVGADGVEDAAEALLLPDADGIPARKQMCVFFFKGVCLMVCPNQCFLSLSLTLDLPGGSAQWSGGS